MRFHHLLLPALLASTGLFAAGAIAADGPAAAASTVVIMASDGASRLTIAAGAQQVEIQAGALHLVGETRGEKRYYHRGKGGAAVVEVKSDGDGFKLRTPDGKLAWKVKFGTDKIKVSDNEQNANAWEIKTGHTDKAKVVDGAGKDVGEVRYADKIKVKDGAGAERFVVENGARSSAYAGLLLANVPEPERLVIVAELLAKGR